MTKSNDISNPWRTVSDTLWANGFGNRTDRMPAPGGWMYRNIGISYDGSAVGVALAFVPDPSAPRVVTPCPDCGPDLAALRRDLCEELYPDDDPDAPWATDTIENVVGILYSHGILTEPDAPAPPLLPPWETTSPAEDGRNDTLNAAARAILDAFDNDDPQHLVTLTAHGADLVERLRQTVL